MVKQSINIFGRVLHSEKLRVETLMEEVKPTVIQKHEKHKFENRDTLI